jgi:hypothetical protein
MSFQYVTSMAAVTRVETDGAQAVVVKRAPLEAVSDLRREGERLRAARHPGVVPLVHSRATDDGWELVTSHAGRPLATVGSLAVAQVAGLVAGLAATLADLHALGIVHGRIDATHVLVGEHGRPILCGFGAGDDPADPEDDVAAIGGLLVDLLGTDEQGEPIPERRWRIHRPGTGWDRRALLLLADQAAAEPATRRPTARRLAGAIADVVPAAPVGRPSALEAGGDLDQADPIERLRATAVVDEPRSARPTRALVVAVLSAALLVGAFVRLLGDEPAPSRTDLAAPPSSTGATPTPTRTVGSVGGPDLHRDGRRYRVGQAGDELLVDDWDCDGDATPALLRPATGEVFVFPRWVAEGSLAVEPVALVDGAQALLSEHDAGACPSLAVRTSTGHVVAVIDRAGR